MILCEDPGPPTKYSCVVTTLTAGQAVPEDLIINPVSFKYQGHRFYRFMFLATGWLFHADSQAPPAFHKILSVSEKGTMIVMKVDLQEIGWFEKMLRGFSDVR
jgi:hypothetical protein